MIKNIIYFTLLVSLIGLTFSAPDSNGVWHRIEDVRTGTFAADENAAGMGSFTFIHPVYFMDPLVGIGTNSPSVELHVAGDILADNLDLNNDLNVGGNSNVFGNSEVQGNFEVGIDTLMNGDLTVLGDTNIGNNLNVSGNITADILNATDIVLGGVNIDDVYVNENQDNSITSNMVVDNSLTINDLGSGSVGTSELVDNSVTNIKLAGDSVDSSKIIDNSVTRNDLAPGIIGTTEIINNSILSSDIRDGTITTADIDQSDFDARYLSTMSSCITVSASSGPPYYISRAVCPVGTTLIFGGGACTDVGGNHNMHRSAPVGNGWEVDCYRNTNDGESSSIAYAICCS